MLGDPCHSLREHNFINAWIKLWLCEEVTKENVTSNIGSENKQITNEIASFLCKSIPGLENCKEDDAREVVANVKTELKDENIVSNARSNEVSECDVQCRNISRHTHA